jgi:hypothetical protein
MSAALPQLLTKRALPKRQPTRRSSSDAGARGWTADTSARPRSRDETPDPCRRLPASRRVESSCWHARDLGAGRDDSRPRGWDGIQGKPLTPSIKRTAMHASDLRHIACDRISAAAVMELGMHGAVLTASRGAPAGSQPGKACPHYRSVSITQPEAGPAGRGRDANDDRRLAPSRTGDGGCRALVVFRVARACGTVRP